MTKRRYDDRMLAKIKERQKARNARLGVVGRFTGGDDAAAPKNAPTGRQSGRLIAPNPDEPQNWRLTPEGMEMARALGWYDGISAMYGFLLLLISVGEPLDDLPQDANMQYFEGVTLKITPKEQKQNMDAHYRLMFLQSPPTNWTLEEVGGAVLTEMMWRNNKKYRILLDAELFYVPDETHLLILPPAWQFGRQRLDLGFDTDPLALYSLIIACGINDSLRRDERNGKAIEAEMILNPIPLSDAQLKTNLYSDLRLTMMDEPPLDLSLPELARRWINLFHGRVAAIQKRKLK